LKILKLLIFCSVFFLSCTQKEKDTTYLYNVNTLDSLMKKALDENISTKQRIFFANKADSIIENSNNKLIKNSYYINLANVFFQIGNKDKYLNLSNRLYKRSILMNDNKGIAESTYCISMYFYNTAEYDSAYFYFKKSEKAYLYNNEKASLAFIKNIRANILTFKKDYVGAEKLSIEALKIAKQEKYNLLIYNCYITLGNSLMGLNNYKKAIEYYKKAIEETNNLKRETQYLNLKTQPYNYIANVYQINLEYNKAIATINQALQFDDFKKNDLAMYCYLTNNLAYSKFKLGDASSLNQFKETLIIGDSIKSIPIQITSKTYLGEFYLMVKDTLKANFYLKEAQKAAHKNNIFDDELKIVQLLEQANPSQSSYYSNRYIELNDSLQNVERATRDKFTRIEFETDEIVNQKEEVSKENNLLYRRIWIISGFALLSLLIIVLWFKNKSQKAKTRELLLKQQQQKANEEIYQLMIDQQQKMDEGKNSEKQRISLELHDGVMGKLSAVRLNLYAALYKANLIENEIFSLQINEIQSVEQEIRNIAHDLNSNLFSDNSNFIGIVKELFSKIENHSQINFTLQVSEAVNWDLVNTDIKIHLYRILQEALQNIEKYANAKNVAVIMTLTETKEIHISISDDGKGFDTNKKKSGIGIKNMNTRVVELNGTFTIQSEIQKGTQINLIIPI
jgi:signal transduction histidine kinase